MYQIKYTMLLEVGHSLLFIKYKKNLKMPKGGNQKP